ncbi:MAG: ATP-grasp domain-containing protein [Clostridia bacterium]|nr:ATP-grasp domain-containing protein [Clostridia bacterium]
MKTGWLIYRKKDAERNRHNITFYENAGNKRGVKILLRYFEEFSYGTSARGLTLTYEGQGVEKPDFVVMRADEPLFSYHLEQMGFRVFNDSYISLVANDKARTLQVAAAAGVPTPESRLARHEDALLVAETLGYPLVIKPRDGHGGIDVLWIKNEASLTETLQNYHHDTFLLQKPVSDLGKDLRVYVVGKTVVAAMLRQRDDDFRSNYCLGGSATRYELSGEEEALVNKVISLFDIGFVGIDFMFSDGKMILNEIEDVVGARMLYHLTDLDVVDIYVEHILKTIG